jgi:hypothetical protein
MRVNNGSEYPIAVDSASTETLITDNIAIRGGKGVVGRAANTAVVSYNYIDDTMYMQSVIGDYWQDMSLNGSHYAGTHHWLFEGNWADNCDNDKIHGTLNSDSKCNTLGRFDIGKVDEDLEECCHAILRALVAGGERPTWDLARCWAFAGSDLPGAGSG